VDRGFDEIVADTDPAMVVVTTAGPDGERAGCLVGFWSQSSIEPRRLALWLSRVNRTYRVAMTADHLAVHVLTAGDDDVAALFGGHTGDDEDKFAQTAWTPGPGGVPVLDRCPHRVVVRRIAVHDDGGDHVCVTGEPVEVASPGPSTPLRLSATRDIAPGHPAR
jgi:flavin reductase (DIM6/NTAB) family NADH-FMN oxidoreductase RutF